MKKLKIILLALMAISILTTSCKKNDDITPSNNVTTLDKTIMGYTELKVSDPFKVYVTFSDTEEKIQVEANSNLQQYINVKKQNNQLVIDLDNNLNINGSSVLNVYITTKSLDAFYATGASTIQLQNELYEPNVTINLSGACTFIGSLIVNELYAELDGASNLELSGSSSSTELDANGASNMMYYGFETNIFNCDLNGGSNAYLSIQQIINVEANGGSNLYYKGNAVVNDHNLNGGSTVQKMD